MLSSAGTLGISDLTSTSSLTGGKGQFISDTQLPEVSQLLYMYYQVIRCCSLVDDQYISVTIHSSSSDGGSLFQSRMILMIILITTVDSRALLKLSIPSLFPMSLV